jgi:hypothetical protein
MRIFASVYAMAICTLAHSAIASAPTLRTDHAEVPYGQAVTLEWNSSGTDAYLTGLGRVAPTGKATITPSATSEYTLVVDDKGSVSFSNVRVRVTGQRGESHYPDPDAFPTGLKATLPGAGYIDFVVRVMDILQSKMSFHVQSIHFPQQTSYTIYTDRLPRNSLVRASDRGIRSRRVSYAVKIDVPHDGVIPFEVMALVDYQRGAESTWRTESDPEVRHLAERQLKEALEERP